MPKTETQKELPEGVCGMCKAAMTYKGRTTTKSITVYMCSICD